MKEGKRKEAKTFSPSHSKISGHLMGKKPTIKAILLGNSHIPLEMFISTGWPASQKTAWGEAYSTCPRSWASLSWRFCLVCQLPSASWVPSLWSCDGAHVLSGDHYA